MALLFTVPIKWQVRLFHVPSFEGWNGFGHHISSLIFGHDFLLPHDGHALINHFLHGDAWFREFAVLKTVRAIFLGFRTIIISPTHLRLLHRHWATLTKRTLWLHHRLFSFLDAERDSSGVDSASVLAVLWSSIVRLFQHDIGCLTMVFHLSGAALLISLKYISWCLPTLWLPFAKVGDVVEFDELFY